MIALQVGPSVMQRALHIARLASAHLCRVNAVPSAPLMQRRPTGPGVKRSIAGAAVGADVGATVGAVGAAVGETVGAPDVGATVGAVGVAVGAAEGGITRGAPQVISTSSLWMQLWR